MVKEDITKLTDEELVHRYRNSHETYYIGELYQRYTHLVFGVCIKYLKNQAEAEDATMQVFEKLISDLKKHHITVFKPWLHVVVKNHCMMEFRKGTAANKNSSNLRYEMGNVVENAEDIHLIEVKEREDREFILGHLQEGMEELNEEQQACIELFYLKDCSYQEISKITGFTMNEVKSYIQNGKRNLKNYITAKNEQLKKG
ncbi:MAG: sigma-70 family RNA polymerase sigma factor [Bacteroidota bacterium]